MRENNHSSWTYSPSLNCMLFFAQRMDELLFHHTTDTYRYSALSIRGLASEFCDVYKSVKKGALNKKNLSHILEEFSERLKNDDIAKEILSDEYTNRFLRNYASWDSKSQYENIQYIGRKLSNRVYYRHLVDCLKRLISDNKEKKEIDEKAALYVRELLDCGYNENYVYQTLHEVFFHQSVTSIESLDRFFDKFDFEPRRFDVYVGYNNDMSALVPLFDKLNISDLKVTMLDVSSAPIGIKTRRQKTILKFEEIESYDMYSAFEIAEAISSCVVCSYAFFRHNASEVRTYGQVVDSEGRIFTIRPQKLLKHRVAARSREESTQNAEELLTAIFANYTNLSSFPRATRIHNAAICSENTSDSILSLWSILESLVADDSNSEENNGDEKDERKERSKIKNIIAYTLPFLKSTYVQKLIQTCMLDIKRWDSTFFEENIANNGYGCNDLEHTFAFLAFTSTQPARDILYAKTEEYPLLRYRVATLFDQLHNTKYIKSIVNVHTRRVEWHLHRIYRARNYIIHDAIEKRQLNQELVINLHSYVDILLTEAVRLINESPYNDSIEDVLSWNKLSVQIMDEQLQNQKNEEISGENFLRYLYYNFER